MLYQGRFRNMMFKKVQAYSFTMDFEKIFNNQTARLERAKNSGEYVNPDSRSFRFEDFQYWFDDYLEEALGFDWYDMYFDDNDDERATKNELFRNYEEYLEDHMGDKGNGKKEEETSGLSFNGEISW